MRGYINGDLNLCFSLFGHKITEMDMDRGFHTTVYFYYLIQKTCIYIYVDKDPE